MRREVSVDQDQLRIGDHGWSRKDFDRIVVVGAGKATAAMAGGLLEQIGDWLPVTGWVNVPEGTAPMDTGPRLPNTDLQHIYLHIGRPAGVNEPTQAGVVGAEEILRLVRTSGPRDLCITLLSGGGSALLPAPVDGITLNDKLIVTRFLSGAGADIIELNTVRKHLSRVKGGGLLRACNAGHLVTVVLSDVLGDPLDMIASGPTVLDTTDATDALRVLRKYDLNRSLPPAVYRVLTGAKPRASAGRRLCPSTTIVIGNNAVAVDHSGIRAERLGYNHAMQSAQMSEGLAEQSGQRLAVMTIEMLRADPKQHRTDCLITGGEPTVALVPADQRGLGGRNQQLVLAAYQHLRSANLTTAEWNRFALLSGGTDGEDGPTDAAGAVLDGQVHLRAIESDLDVDDHLRRNDAYRFFDSCGGLVKTGPTGTNVCDIRVVVVKP